MVDLLLSTDCRLYIFYLEVDNCFEPDNTQKHLQIHGALERKIIQKKCKNKMNAQPCTLIEKKLVVTIDNEIHDQSQALPQGIKEPENEKQQVKNLQLHDITDFSFHVVTS